MKVFDATNARGANAGYDYQELWALRHALTLLDAEPTLTSITVEGVGSADAANVPAGTWDGVDCTL